MEIEFEVVVENIGTVYRGKDGYVAQQEFNHWAANLGVGRIGSHVALIGDGEIVEEWEL